MTGHTELPWTTSGWDTKHNAATIWARSFGSPIAAACYMGGTAQAEANAALIVKAVNMHERLLIALKGLDEASELIRNAWDQEDAYRIFEQAQQNARALLAEAREDA